MGSGDILEVDLMGLAYDLKMEGDRKGRPKMFFLGFWQLVSQDINF